MPQYNDPNMALANHIGGSLAQLFGPPDRERQLKYLEGASAASRDQAGAQRYRSAAALDDQTHDNRAVYTPATVSEAFGIQNPAMARIQAANLGQGGNASQMVDATGHMQGFQRLANAKTEGEARIAYALTGNSAPSTSPLTGGGMSDAFSQATALNAADNANALARTGLAADASRYGADRLYSASTENNAANIDAGRWDGKSGDGANDGMSVGDYSKLGKDFTAVYPGADSASIEDATQRTGAYLAQGMTLADARRKAGEDVFGPNAQPTPVTQFVDTFGPGGEQQPVLDDNGQQVMRYDPLPYEQRPAFPQSGAAAAAQPQVDQSPGGIGALFEQVLPELMDMMGKQGAAPAPAQNSRQVVRTGTSNGRKVVQYNDGTLEYAD